MCLGLLAQTRLDRLQAQLKSENISAAVSQPELTDEAPCDTQLQCPTCTPCTSCVEETRALTSGLPAQPRGKNLCAPCTFPTPCFTPSRPGSSEPLPQDKAQPLPRHASHAICQCGIEKGQANELAALGKRSGRCQVPRTRKLSRVADFSRRFPSAPS
ncbi:hypothetical protein Anapl_03561 [Anas platyrhynchos]|uniref:Uncharacterized protein n=1 Tax=Anas platyrhynchos TaxID=8839 RepID=R0LYY6_ANAPL|nr:hypothetical protein Anapl_03561 [Anas platyrhynchos]